jgi:hypothetical protein
MVSDNSWSIEQWLAGQIVQKDVTDVAVSG